MASQNHPLLDTQAEMALKSQVYHRWKLGSRGGGGGGGGGGEVREITRGQYIFVKFNFRVHKRKTKIKEEVKPGPYSSKLFLATLCKCDILQTLKKCSSVLLTFFFL